MQGGVSLWIITGYFEKLWLLVSEVAFGGHVKERLMKRQVWCRFERRDWEFSFVLF